MGICPRVTIRPLPNLRHRQPDLDHRRPGSVTPGAGGRAVIPEFVRADLDRLVIGALASRIQSILLSVRNAATALYSNGGTISSFGSGVGACSPSKTPTVGCRAVPASPG